MTASEFKTTSADLCHICMTRAQYIMLALGTARALAEKNGHSWPITRAQAEHTLDAIDRILILSIGDVSAATRAELVSTREKVRLLLRKKWPHTIGLPIR